ncbi:MAG: DUF2177 family protein [Myxococcales bacterium]|nr:DUF2177 family protein [Myxococcales bacterium]
MTISKLLTTWFATFVLIAAGNAITHGAVGGARLTAALDLVAPSAMNPAVLSVVWALIAAATVYFVIRERAPSWTRSMIAGAVVGLLVDGAWNIINKALWAQWSGALIAVDITWHVVHGAAAGALVYALTRRSLETHRG